MEGGGQTGKDGQRHARRESHGAEDHALEVEVSRGFCGEELEMRRDGLVVIAEKFRELVLEVAARRRREGKAAADTLGIMIQARDRERGDPMPDAQLAREVLNLVVAGHETTASLLNWMWYVLASHPEAQGRLAAEFDH